ncbi:small heat shock protein [Clavulina sp. PMI_390]|nr:small heat shock protein [Clavulina sp. PMI_390]
MSLSRFFYNEPFLAMRQFDRFFDDALRGRVVPMQGGSGSMFASNGSSFTPKFDLKETSNGLLTASFELPGMTKDDVKIELHKDHITISGEAKSSYEWIVRERSYGRFEQSLPIPQGIEADKINASVANGVLTVTFPKVAPADPEPKKITVS